MRVAVVQASPVLFDKAATLQKTIDLSRKAAAAGAELILFPESYIPAYPRGLRFGSPVGSRSEAGRAQWSRYWEESVEMDGPECATLAKLAAELQCWIVIGVTERAGGTLYCSLWYFSPKGALAQQHRKLKPTAAERIVWGEGRGDDLGVVETGLGPTGGLICWENYMPLARMALYEQGVNVYLAPTADHRERWQHSLSHIALEGRCFVLAANQVVHKADYPKDLPDYADLDAQPELMSKGGSVIYGPLGEPIAGPVWDVEEVLYADLAYADLIAARLAFDVSGHYARPDVFTYSWPGKPY